MGLEGVVRAGRRTAERLMIDTCTVHAVTSEAVDDEGRATQTQSLVYSGRCKVQTFEAYEQTPEAVGATRTVQRYSVHVPVGSFDPAVGQTVIITAARLDPNLVGVQFRVAALLHKTAATAYRLAVEATA